MSLPTLLSPPPPDFPNVAVKAQPEDFVVEEIPLYEPGGSGTHTYLWIEKRQLNTLDAVRRIAALLGKRAADAGVAGLKDAQALTRQWISFEHVPAGKLEELKAHGDPNLRVLKISSHTNKLRMGHLRGNRFAIRLRVETPDAAQRLAARAHEVLAVLEQCGLPNYYGPQRFGRNADNAEAGRALVRGETAAFEQYVAQHYAARRPDVRKLRNLLVNAFQSELFNRVLARRMPKLGHLQAGDVAWLHRNGAVFRVGSEEDAAREQRRADAFEISPSGPLFGPKMLQAEGAPGEIETAVLRESGVTLEAFARREAERQPGARRPLRVPLLEAPASEADASGLALRFALPPGSYASILIREIIGRESGLESPAPEPEGDYS